MSNNMKWLNLVLSSIFGIISICSQAAFTTDSVTLYTPYSKITVPPGESVDYTIDVINNSKELRNLEIALVGIPKGWNYVLKSGNWNIRQLSILPGAKQVISLRVEVPLNVNKGSYRFRILAGGSNSLPLVITVSEQGTFETEFTTEQSNMQGHAKATFNFSAILKNRTSEKQLYSLKANVQRGWNVIFRANGNQVTSVNVEPNNTENINIEIKAPDNIQAGTYKIPVSTGTSTTSATLDLEVVITGSFNMELTTPTGLLSASITAGDEKRVELLVKNTGSSALTDINLTASAPANWDVLFDPKKVDRLEPGKDTRVFATIKADKRAIAGDYMTNINAKTPEVSSTAAFRISVKTPLLLGWIGIMVIILALGSVYYLFQKYGRR